MYDAVVFIEKSRSDSGYKDAYILQVIKRVIYDTKQLYKTASF